MSHSHFEYSYLKHAIPIIALLLARKLSEHSNTTNKVPHGMYLIMITKNQEKKVLEPSRNQLDFQTNKIQYRR